MIVWSWDIHSDWLNFVYTSTILWNINFKYLTINKSFVLKYFKGKLWTTYKLLSCSHYMLSYHRIVSFSVVSKAVSVHVFFRINYLGLKSCMVPNLRDLTKYFPLFLLKILLILFNCEIYFLYTFCRCIFCFKYCVFAMTTTILRSSLCIKMADYWLHFVS